MILQSRLKRDSFLDGHYINAEFYNFPDIPYLHGWIPSEAIKQAQAMYQQKNDFDPNKAYDLEIARAVLKE